MKKNFFILFLLFCYHNSNAQDNKKLQAGFNTGRLLYNFALGQTQGYSIDPVLKYKYNELLFELEGGYTYGKRNSSRIPNLEFYKNVGYYFRIGAGGFVEEGTSLGIGFNYSQSIESFTSKFNGSIFNSYYYEYVRGKLTTKAIDIRLQHLIRISDKFDVALGGSAVYMISFLNDRPIPVDFQDVPYRYIVGIGEVLFTINEVLPRPSKLTFNFQFQLLYNIHSK